ncbi:hypothetical protein FQN54_009569 [Arachnomyces sp. PD_36]|nr:hypothetical protein FQN54_009569 [Arachnomyces sp. PD_36]
MNYGQGDENKPSKGYQLYITALVMVLVAALFVAARLGTRFSKKKVGIDDYMITISLVSRPLTVRTRARIRPTRIGLFGFSNGYHKPRCRERVILLTPLMIVIWAFSSIMATIFHVCVTSIIRTTVVAQTTADGGKKDITWDFIPRSIWTLIEANMGIICACLPILKGPIVRFFPRVFQATTSKSNGAYRSSGGDSYALHDYHIRGTSGSKTGGADYGNPRSSQKHKDETIGPWAGSGSEERIIEPIGEEVNDEGPTDRIMKKTDVTIAYERTQSSRYFR